MLIFDDEDGIETGQDGRHEIDILFSLAVIPATENRVGRSENGTAWIQSRSNSGLEEIFEIK